MSATEADVRALEHLARRIREDTHGCGPWDPQGTHVVFQRELKGMHLVTATELVLAHAPDPDARTPKAITRPFTPKVEKTRRGDIPPTRTEECPRHPGQFPAPHCAACATEPVRADYDSDTRIPGATAKTARALLRGETL